RITNVAAGGVYQGSTDAVNGDQLWNAYQRIDEVQEDAYRAGAHAAALSALHPVAYDPYRPTTISAGLGFYHSKQSVAVGLFHYVKDSVLLNAGVSLNGDGDAMGRVGISFAMGKGGRQAIVPAKAEAMQKRIEELEERNERNEAAIKEMAEMIRSLQAKIAEK
ncbi:MAG: YadA-like family protein, partial [Synergistes sp.]|nr:YadA-like family protein [Synergistes sp.]